MPSSQSRDQLAGNEAKITVEVFLSSPHQVYIVNGALSSIYIILLYYLYETKINFLLNRCYTRISSLKEPYATVTSSAIALE